MLKMFFAALIAAALLSPAPVDAYGAYHRGYTHVGPNGVQHYGETVYRGPNSAGYASHGAAYGYGGAAYHAGYGGAAVGGYQYGGYHYGSAYHYGYVR